jgi:hypothetical protein
MVAFQYRMGAGFAGDVNRTHPASIEPGLLDATNPPAGYGVAVQVNTAANSIRGLLATDYAATNVYGVTVRPYPFQQSTAALANAAVGFGSAGIFAGQPVDVLRSGYIMVPVVGAPTKGGAVWVWYAAASGSHITGGFEAAAFTPLTGTASGGTNGTNTITFASTPVGVVAGMTVSDTTGGHSAYITAGTYVTAVSATTVTLSANIVTTVTGDTISFAATTALTWGETFFNSPADANGIAELQFNV